MFGLVRKQEKAQSQDKDHPIYLNDFKTPQKKIESLTQNSTQASKQPLQKPNSTIKKQTPINLQSDIKQKITNLTDGLFSINYLPNNTVFEPLDGEKKEIRETFSVVFNFTSLENAFEYLSYSKGLLLKYHERVTYNYALNSKLLMQPPSFGIFLKNVKFLEMQLQMSLLNLEKVLKTFLKNFVPEVEESVYDIEQSSIRSYYQIPELSSVDREIKEKKLDIDRKQTDGKYNFYHQWFLYQFYLISL